MQSSSPTVLEHCVGRLSELELKGVQPGMRANAGWARAMLRGWWSKPTNEWMQLVHWRRPQIDAVSRLFHGIGQRPSCAIIGSAPFLRTSELGETIDAHDVVMRANFAPSRGYERHVGARTDVRVMAHTYVPSNISEGSVIVHRYNSRNYAVEDRSANRQYTIVRLIAKPLQMIGTHGKKRIMTSGLAAVLLATYACANVSIFGFDLAGVSQGHYYDDERVGLVANINELLRREMWRLERAPSTIYIERNAGAVTIINGTAAIRLRSAKSYSAHVTGMYAHPNDHNLRAERTLLSNLALARCISVYEI
jgi:hypothetical protein